MRCILLVLGVLLAIPALAQPVPIPGSVLRRGSDAERLLRPPPRPLAVMREFPEDSAIAAELARLGVEPSREAIAGRDRGAAAAARADRTAAPEAASPGAVDLRGVPPGAATIRDALNP